MPNISHMVKHKHGLPCHARKEVLWNKVLSGFFVWAWTTVNSGPWRGEGGNISLHQQEGKFSRGENYREDRVGRQVEENVL